jgi:hypothetical protein
MRSITERLLEPRRWVYLAASLPAVLIALYGWEVGAFLPYALATVAFIACYVYPTIVGWWISIAVYCLATLVTGYVLVRDASEVVAGKSPGIFTNAQNSWIAVIWMSLLVVVTTMLWQARPWRPRRRPTV